MIMWIEELILCALQILLRRFIMVKRRWKFFTYNMVIEKRRIKKYILYSKAKSNQNFNGNV